MTTYLTLREINNLKKAKLRRKNVRKDKHEARLSQDYVSFIVNSKLDITLRYLNRVLGHYGLNTLKLKVSQAADKVLLSKTEVSSIGLSPILAYVSSNLDKIPLR